MEKNIQKPAYISSYEQQHFDELYKTVIVNGTMIFAGSLLQRAAHNYPDRVALLCENESITFDQLYRRALALTHKLIAAGIGPDRSCFFIV